VGDKGTLDKQITGFITGVVNKRPDNPTGSFNVPNTACFSYMRTSGGVYSVVVVAPTEVDSDILRSFLETACQKCQGKEDKTQLQDIIAQLLKDYASVTTLDKLKELQKRVEPTQALASPGEAASPLEPVGKFFHSVYDKTQHRDPSRDPLTHFVISVEDSYNEQGGTEAVVKVLKHVETATKEQIHKIEEDIAKQGVGEFLKGSLVEVEKAGLEVGGVLMDKYDEIDKEVKKSGGIQPYLQKEMEVVEQTVVPVATQATSVIMETGAQAGGLLLDKVEKIQKDVEKVGGVDKYLKAESEEALAKGMELGSVLAAGAAEFNQEVQEKGFQVAFLNTWTNLSKAFAPKEKSSSESFGDSD